MKVRGQEGTSQGSGVVDMIMLLDTGPRHLVLGSTKNHEEALPSGLHRKKMPP